MVLGAATAFADPKPKNAKITDSQTVANFYAGTSRIWTGCKGGVYFGGGFEATAYCNKQGPAVAVGKWSVKKGVICSNLTWFWKEGSGVGSKPGDRPNCIAHVTDAEGNIWRRWNDDTDWWRLQPIKDDTKAKKGNAFKGKISRMRRKLNV
ncbi:hypothetical protein ATO11_10130 [Pseudaestuariivita atlantica]|uniref:DUF995 domain-containing protein n=1 Tax=Pseudaestuariivita atlantica TaxID=1317121 RepID=A0A0L1JP72_9RHOB|nr:hypothetical protein ATO11_10130 [Pseudaestuariivita atlantica]